MGDVQPDLRRRQGDYGADGDFRVIPACWQAVIAAATADALVALMPQRRRTAFQQVMVGPSAIGDIARPVHVLVHSGHKMTS